MTTAASSSSTCATRPAWRRWCSATPASWSRPTDLRAEFCVAVEGVVEARPEGNANAEIATGDIEVNATSLTVLSESAPLPFQLDETAGEEARLKYRYLDLRREGPANAIRLRSKVNAAARTGSWASTTSSRSRRPR